MIELKPRPNVPPAVLKSLKVASIKRALAAKVTKGEKLKKEDFKSVWSDPELKDRIWEMHRRKCCYCERQRDKTREPDVEHFRPKAGITGEKDHPGYWWLAYEWSNYLFSCKHCNQEHKRNHFPLRPGGRRARNEGDDPGAEKPYLINPAEEDPEACICYEWSQYFGRLVKPIGVDSEGRGHRTIKLLGLDRLRLNELRAGIVRDLQNLVDLFTLARLTGSQQELANLKDQIKEATSSEREFAGFRRTFFKGHGLGQYIAHE